MTKNFGIQKCDTGFGRYTFYSGRQLSIKNARHLKSSIVGTLFMHLLRLNSHQPIVYMGAGSCHRFTGLKNNSGEDLYEGQLISIKIIK